MPLTVAVDIGPLHGHRTGVATAVAGLLAGLDGRDDVRIRPYLVSFRARPVAPQRRLPLPAGVAMRLWARSDHPRADRWLPDVDLVHGTNYVAPPARLPTVVSVYDCWFLTHPDEATPAVRRAADVLRRAVRRGARLHVSSHATATVAADVLATERISVVHLGPPDAPATRPDASPDAVPAAVAGRPLLVAVGTTERRKDVPALVAAFGVVAPARPDLHLVVAGAPGDDHARVVAAVDALPGAVRGRVHLVGRVDGPTRDALLAHAVALVYPSRDEGFGFPILEAQMAGTPVVATRAGSIPEVGGDAVELVDAGSVDALAVGIARVVDDEARQRDLVTAGHANLRRFSWDRTAHEMVDVYHRTIDEHAP